MEGIITESIFTAVLIVVICLAAYYYYKAEYYMPILQGKQFDMEVSDYIELQQSLHRLLELPAKEQKRVKRLIRHNQAVLCNHLPLSKQQEKTPYELLNDLKDAGIIEGDDIRRIFLSQFNIQASPDMLLKDIDHEGRELTTRISGKELDKHYTMNGAIAEELKSRWPNSYYDLLFNMQFKRDNNTNQSNSSQVNNKPITSHNGHELQGRNNNGQFTKKS